jgi:hypothetical protein
MGLTKKMSEASKLIDETESLLQSGNEGNFDQARENIRRLEVDYYWIIKAAKWGSKIRTLRIQYADAIAPDYIFGQRARNNSEYSLGARARRKTKDAII